MRNILFDNQLSCIQQDHLKIYLAYAKSGKHFFPTEWHKIFFNFGSMSRISPHPIRWVISTKNSLHFTIWKIEIHQSTFWTSTSTSLLSGTDDSCLKGFPFCYCLPRWHNHLQQDCWGILRPHQTGLQEITECSIIDEAQQMPLLCKRNPVSWTHMQHHGHQTTTIQDPGHQQHAFAKNCQTSMCLCRTCWILDEIHQELC